MVRTGIWVIISTQLRTGICFFGTGACHVHEQFSVEKIVELKAQHPEALVLAHPECKSTVLKLADVVGSTAALLKYAVNHPENTYIVATESGILHEMQKEMSARQRLFRLLLMIVRADVMSVALCG